METACSRPAGGGRLDLGLIHFPVCNKNREVIGSAVTNLDLHDIARAGRTYGVGTFYVVTPFEDQQQLVQDILAHWLTGAGSRYNGCRKEALEIIRICADMAGLYEQADVGGSRPTVLATCARPQARTWSYREARERMTAGEHLLVLFGTAWGLAPEVLEGVDGLLPPIEGGTGYNHLSVRSAVAIVLDRLCGTYT